MKVIYSRKSNRLSNWNYSENGKYFITICTKNRICILGKGIVGDAVPYEGACSVLCINI